MARSSDLATYPGGSCRPPSGAPFIGFCDKPLPQDESQLPELFARLQEDGKVLVVVDQPNTIGALPVAVARDCGCEVAYLPGLAMRKAPRPAAADLPGPGTGPGHRKVSEWGLDRLV
jgi:hypothetical protein